MTKKEAWRRAKGYLYDALSEEEADEIIKALEQEPCGDLISRQAALEPYKILNDTDTLCVAVIRANILQQPPINPQPKMGHWEWQTEDIYRCSECGEDIHVKEVMNVPQYKCCPMCLAKMQEVEE